MKNAPMIKRIVIALSIVVGVALIAGVAFALFRRSDDGNRRPAAPAETMAPDLSFPNGSIAHAEEMIRRHPSNPDPYNQLASAYLQKARETGDFSLNDKAQAAITKAQQLDPDNFDAYSLRALVLLNYHRFSEALSTALKAQSLRPATGYLYGAIVDARVELGDYDQAVQTAQQMVDIRPDTASYSRIAHIRSLYGDTQGAIEVMTQAVKSAGNSENAAWCRIHLGIELMNLGKMAEAERQFDFALQDVPGFYQALAAKARTRAIAGDYGAAIQLYKESKERVPQPDTIMALGDLYASLGRMDEAQKEYEFLAIIERAAPDPQIYNRQMALFWADHDQRLDDALNTARQERAARADIYSSDLLGWCLYKKNMLAEARQAIDEALKLGARDARIYYHAGMIYQALGERTKAIRYMTDALTYRVSFDNSISSFGPLQERKAKEALQVLQGVAKIGRE